MYHVALIITIAASLGFSTYAAANQSLLDRDPDVIYLDQHFEKIITLMAAKTTAVYASKNGSRRLGVFKAGTKVQLLAITDKVYRVRGRATHAGVTGWVDPKQMASTDKNFISNLKDLYDRQIAVLELISMRDVAIGMTLSEVTKSLGEPTEAEVQQTRDGTSGKWDYVITEEQKHYRTVIHPRTRRVYRQLSHVTIEERSRTTLRFQDNVVTSITKKKNNGAGDVRIIPAPVRFHW